MTGREDPAREAREDAEWRSIVDNFGERADLPAEPEPVVLEPEPELVAYSPAELARLAWDDDDTYVPPEAPPVPRPTGVRAVAWFGLFGVPTVALLMVVLGWSMPSYLQIAFIAWFVGGFGYLVATMSDRADPDSGWDDGAVL